MPITSIARAFLALAIISISFPVPPVRAAEPLLQSADLRYLGAFRLPRGEHGDPQGFSYGGGPIAYNHARNSLFVGNRSSKVAEVSIPAPVDAKNFDELPFSAVLQNFADPAKGSLAELNAISPASLSGLLVADGKLYGTAAIYYDAANVQTKSHFAHSLNLADDSGAIGLQELTHSAGKAGYLSGWLLDVPEAWRSRLGGSALSGQCCIPIVSRTSWGPAAFAWEPGRLGSAPTEAVPLLYYSGAYPTLGSWSGSNPVYGGTTRMGGAVIPRGTRTLLFFGSNGTGLFCYGEGVGDPAKVGEHDCYDPTNASKGQHAYPYNYQMWAYDLEELAAVKRGEKKPWELRPYGVWPLEFPIPDTHYVLGGVAYDPQSRRIFVSQLRTDKDGYSARALIHVFEAPSLSAQAQVSPFSQPTAPSGMGAVMPAALPRTPSVLISKNLKHGLRNDADVRALQGLLVREGLLPGDAQTGNFFNLTLAAVKNYQKKHGIRPVSGFVGPLTRARLAGT